MQNGSNYKGWLNVTHIYINGLSKTISSRIIRYHVHDSGGRR
jgi:hypothetical protein